uniref:Uncharacterized protein n=1 Tax=Chaetoceros debilis TaxID=122233 RepID=A0A7S3V745_9STRA
MMLHRQKIEVRHAYFSRRKRNQLQTINKRTKRRRRLRVAIVAGLLAYLAVSVFFDSVANHSVERKLQQCIQIPEAFFRRIEQEGLDHNPCNSIESVEAGSSYEEQSFYADEELTRCVFRSDCSQEVSRHLVKRCTTLSDVISESKSRNLKKGYSLAEISVRVLELNNGNEAPCLTNYPTHLEQPTRALTEPNYVIGSGGKAPVEDAYNDEDHNFLLPPDKIGDVSNVIDEAVNLYKSFPQRSYDSDTAKKAARNETTSSIGYILPLDQCPEWDFDCSGQPQKGRDLYEASAIIKSQICDVTEIAAERRRLGGHTRKLETSNGTMIAPAAERDYQMIAVVHPTAIECPIKGYVDTPYDRVQLLQQLNFNVEILGHPITESDLIAAGQIVLRDSVADDVGFRDLMKLQSWGLTLHPVVVMLNYDRQLKEPLDDKIDLLLANDMLKGLYVLHAPDSITNDFGVDTGMMIIKPSKNELVKITEAYKYTNYSKFDGWNGTNLHLHKGGAGLSGFLRYYFENVDPDGYEKLDRCIFAHDGGKECNSRVPPEDIKTGVTIEGLCGNPRDCPYDHPFWEEDQRQACEDQHRKYFESRYKFEQDFWNKDTVTQERIGLFKPKSFLGYCTEPGPDGFLPMIGSVIETPEWVVVCDYNKKCPEGSVKKRDCTCTELEEDPCAACPENTICQTEPTLMCIHCECGFSDLQGLPCCMSNGNNECEASVHFFHGDECQTRKNFFPAFGGEGNVCNLLNAMFRTHIPQGCGCKPSSQIPCSFDDTWGESNRSEKNFICTTYDLAMGYCEACKECLKVGCQNSGCIDRSFGDNEFQNCLTDMDSEECRRDCIPECSKTAR